MSAHKIDSFKHREHLIEVVQNFGWSDNYQKAMPNGFRLIVEGPHFNESRQTYILDTDWVTEAIDRAICRANGVIYECPSCLRPHSKYEQDCGYKYCVDCGGDPKKMDKNND